MIGEEYVSTPNNVELSKIDILQRKLYRKAKAEPDYRFYTLYDKIFREDVIDQAYKQARANGGAPGVDGVTFKQIEKEGRAEWLADLRKDLIERTYRPSPVRRVMLPKPGGGERPLGIPTIRDRVAQTAAKLILEPIIEADLEDCAYGYRPNRSGVDAVKKVHELIRQGYTDVVDADLSKFFDKIPHAPLLKSVARRIADRNVLWLIKMWLKAPVEERDSDGKRRIIGGGKQNKLGTPQGGVVSPLLANLYMNRFLKHWHKTGRGKEFCGHIINYADDFVILTRKCASEAMEWTKEVMTKLELTLNETKTKLKDAKKEHFDFLGYTFGPYTPRKGGRPYMGAGPSKKSVGKIKTKIGEILVPGNLKPWAEVSKELNATLRGWAGYFNYGACSKAYRIVDNYVDETVRHFLRRRHKVRTRGYKEFPGTDIIGKYGVMCLRRVYSKSLPRKTPAESELLIDMR